MGANPVAENPVVAALAGRARANGSEPLLTWYRPETGGRTELSVRTLANWVDKTANLLSDLGVEGMVAGPVSLAHPGHWMSLLWPLAAWQHGSAWLAGEPQGPEELVVGGPDVHHHPGTTTLACSLHPLGLGLRELPHGVLDFTGEALAQPDAHWSEPVSWSRPAWVDDAAQWSHADTGALAGQAGRVLVRPGTAWDTLAAAVLGPVLGGGSAVVVEGPVEEDALARIAAAERITTGLA
jgi:uncharacterized protein (TIGR03089 family)